MKRFVIDRHPGVRQDLFDLAKFIGEYAGYGVADKKAYEIESAIAGLSDFPHIGTIRNEIASGLRAIPCADKAIICFTVDDDARTVRIVCVTYAGQDWQEIARSREML